MASIREKVLKTINSELGTDLKNLSKCEGLAKKFLDEKESIEQKVKVCYYRPIFHECHLEPLPTWFIVG